MGGRQPVLEELYMSSDNQPPPRIAARAAADPQVARAVKFHQTFVPKREVNYAWAVEHEKARYEFALKVFDDLDAKASALIGYVGNGAGLVTLGSIAGVTS